jgi:hypothetical protein
MATKKKISPDLSAPPEGPKDLDGWRALYPDPEAQRTIDEVVAGLERAREDGDSSVLHSAFEEEVGIPIKRQPKDPFIWLCHAKSLWLTNVTPFDDVVLTDVRPLEPFKQLKLLKISAAFETDLSTLRLFEELTDLYVRGGEKTDWSWLSSLSNLEVLKLATSQDGRAQVEAAPHFKLLNNAKLQHFEWSGNYDDISHLGLGKQVKRIKLLGKVSDISSLAGIVALRELDLRGCQVRDITPLFKLPNLEVLDVSWNQIANLHGIEGFSKLRLDAEFNCISDLEPYRRLMSKFPDHAESWIKKTASTQLKLTTPEARAVYDDWLNLDKWRALADVLEAAGDPMGKRIRLRLSNEKGSGLPWFWARGTMTRDPSWK